MLHADFAARYTETKSIAFSLVSGTAANQLLEDLHLTQVDGFEEAPFETPAGERPYSKEEGIQTWLATTCASHGIKHIVTLQV
jgi:hypothetical protein